MKILVVGGAGYVGSVLIPKLLDRGYEIDVVDLFWFGNYLPEQVGIIEKDVFHLKEEDVRKYNQVIFLAGLSNDPMAECAPAMNFIFNNAAPTYLAFISKKAGVKRFIYASSCHDSETKLVTKNGIKNYWEINKEDRVYSFNMDANIIEEVPIDKIIIKQYSGKLVCCAGRSIDLAVTPDHNILYRTTSKSHRKYLVDSAKNLVDKSIMYFPSPIWKGEKVLGDRFYKLAYLLGLFIGDGYIVHTFAKGVAKTGLRRCDYLRVGRGSDGKFIPVKHNPRRYAYPYTYIEFAIPKTDSARKKLIEVLGLNHIKFNDTDHNRVSIHGRKDLEEIFSACGRGAKKKIIPKYVLSGSYEELQLLFEGLMDSDGDKKRIYSTSSKQLKSDFVELCIKLGYRASVLKRNTKSPSSNNYNESYLITVAKRPKMVTRKNFYESDYKGKVWCLTVKNHNFLTVRNDKYIFSGNCSIYGYRVNELCDEESGTMRTCSFPYGISKFQGEQGVLQMVDETFSVICLRKGTISGYSPRMRLDLIVNTMFKCAIKDKQITVTNPTLWRPILAIQDAVTAYVRAIESDETISGVFNIASGNYTVGEVADLVNQGVDGKIKLDIKHIPDLRSYKVKTEKAKEVLGFTATHDVQDIVQELVENANRFSDFDNPKYSNIQTFKELKSWTLENV